MEQLRQASAVCSQRIREALFALPPPWGGSVEEIRLRCGQPPTYLKSGKEIVFSDFFVRTSDLEEVIDRASESSVYAAQHMLKNGFLTICGGHRIGICGTGVYKDGEITTLKDISSVNIRIARQFRGIADRAVSFLWTHPESTLILGPPGRGKTTMLRELIRQLSDRFFWRICVVDERMEIASCVRGVSQFALGAFTDILSGVRKDEGIEFLLRSMNPQWIAVDEITACEDVEAMMRAAYCGVRLLATAHACDAAELKHRPVYAKLLASKVFRNVIVIGADRKLHMEVLENG